MIEGWTQPQKREPSPVGPSNIANVQTPAEILQRAAASARESVERNLLVAAAVQSSLDVRAVLVGGSAVRIYDETYGPTDIDLVTRASASQVRDSLLGLGFVKSAGRHWEYEFADGEIVLVEFVGDTMFPSDIPPEAVPVTEEVTVEVVAPHALLLDRMLQRQSGDIPESELRNLVAGLGNLIDWPSFIDYCDEYESRGKELRGLGVLVRTVAAWVANTSSGG